MESENGEPQEEAQPPTGLFCFLNQDRVCGAECMAFVTFPKMSQSSELEGQAVHCGLLSSVERAGRGLIALAQMQAEAARKQGIAQADQRRKDQLDPARAAVQSPFGSRKE